MTNHNMTCGHCGRTWNDKETPTPAARCPYEYEHEYLETAYPTKHKEENKMRRIVEIPDGTIVFNIGPDMAMNWHEDTPEYVEVEEFSADEPEYHSRDYLKVSDIEKFLNTIKDKENN